MGTNYIETRQTVFEETPEKVYVMSAFGKIGLLKDFIMVKRYCGIENRWGRIALVRIDLGAAEKHGLFCDGDHPEKFPLV